MILSNLIFHWVFPYPRASGQYVHVVLCLAYRGQHCHSGHLYPHAFFLSHSLSEIHCFYSPSNLGVSLASLIVILLYIISVFHTICNLFYWLLNKWGGISYFHMDCAFWRRFSWLSTRANPLWLIFIPPIGGLCVSPLLIFHWNIIIAWGKGDLICDVFHYVLMVRVASKVGEHH